MGEYNFIGPFILEVEKYLMDRIAW
jgi:hypothetical protein